MQSRKDRFMRQHPLQRWHQGSAATGGAAVTQVSANTPRAARVPRFTPAVRHKIRRRGGDLT
jgi:hypothetical protein